MAFGPGTGLAPHEILAPVAAGGIGEVYHARRTRFGRDAVLKICPGSINQRSPTGPPVADCQSHRYVTRRSDDMRPIPATLILVYVTLCVSFSLEAQLRGVPTQNIDRAINACTDFDAYANGNWRAEHPMPATESNWAIRTATQEETRAHVRTIAEEDAAKSEALHLGSPGRLTGDFYASCIDQARLDSLGVKPLEAYQKVIDNVHDAKTLSAAIIRLQQIKINAPIDTQPLQDPHETTRIIADIGIAGLGMPDRDYYLRDEERFSSVREKYVAYAKKLLALAGTPAPDAERIVAAAMKIETALARDSLTRVERRNPKAEDHPMSFVDLKLLAPRFDWDEEFRALGLPEEVQLNVSQPKLTRTFDALLESASVEEWRAYLRWSLLNSSAEYLSSAIERPVSTSTEQLSPAPTSLSRDGSAVSS
jgi:putative endopeptidase